MNEKTVVINILENVNDQEITNLLQNLNKIKGLQFRIKTFIEVHHSQT